MCTQSALAAVREETAAEEPTLQFVPRPQLPQAPAFDPDDLPIPGVMPGHVLYNIILAFDPYELIEQPLGPMEHLGLLLTGKADYALFWGPFLREIDLLPDSQAEAILYEFFQRDVFALDPAAVREMPQKKLAKLLAQQWEQARQMLATLRIQKRWAYWMRALAAGEYPTGRVPQLRFTDVFDQARTGEGLKMLGRVGRILDRGGGWHNALDHLCDLILYLYGEVAELPGYVSPEIWTQAYQALDLPLLWAAPADYVGHLTTEEGRGQKGLAYFPTPMNMCLFMAAMAMTDQQGRAGAMDVAEQEPYTGRVNDPAVGSGRLLMAASNCCLNLWGGDVWAYAIKMTRVNAALYVPWLLHPLDGNHLRQGNTLAGDLAADRLATSQAFAEERRAVGERRRALYASLTEDDLRQAQRYQEAIDAAIEQMRDQAHVWRFGEESVSAPAGADQPVGEEGAAPADEVSQAILFAELPPKVVPIERARQRRAARQQEVQKEVADLIGRQLTLFQVEESEPA